MNLMNHKLTLTDIIKMSGLKEDNSIVETVNPYSPAIIPSSFVPEINYFEKSKSAVFYCFTIETDKFKVYYSPSVELVASLMLRDENEIRRMLGEGTDALTIKEEKSINSIINAMNNPDSYTKSKGFHNLTSKRGVDYSYFSGHAGNGTVKSKVTGEYDNVFKQLITCNDKGLIMPENLETICTCPLSVFSYTKKEFENLKFYCHHTIALHRDLGQKYKMLIFNPFNLCSPEIASPYLRKILRIGLENFVLKGRKILKRNDYKKAYNNNGCTWNRVELDAFLLSFKEVYNPKVMEWFGKYYNHSESVLKTSLFFKDVEVAGVKESSAEHEYNNLKNEWMHSLNHQWRKVEHAIKDKNTNEIFLPLNDNYIKFDNNTKEFIVKNHEIIDDKKIIHNPKTFQHEGINNTIFKPDIEAVHLEKEWQINPYKSYNTPFKVAKLPDNSLLYLSPYQMRKIKKDNPII